jgi:hypothetical protein
MNLRKLFQAAIAALLFLLPVLPIRNMAWAQTNAGVLAGTVYDPSSNAVPNAKITARNDASGTAYSTISNASGLYRFAGMAVGSYTVTANAPGFTATTYDKVQISVGNVTALDMHLTVGATAETVTVNSDALSVETETSDVAGVITANQIENLPLVLGGMKGTRAPEAFTYLLPGTVAFGTGGNGIGGGTATPGYNSKISGSQGFGSEVLLDGADTFRSENGSTFDETAPSVDAIQEFKVELSSPSAEFGRTTGGIELFTTKSGTNGLHGGLYDFLQNNDLNANTWFNNLNRATQPDTPANQVLFATPIDKKNDFGGYVGGPVWIPKVYNGHNRSFFFVSWERFDQHQSATNNSFVPEASWLAGNFSDRLGSPTSTINPCTGQPLTTGQIFDPSTERTVATSTGPVTCRSPFPNNIIPAGDFSTVAKNLISYFPTPNLTRANASLPNYSLSTTGLNLNTMLTVRIDQNIAQNHKVFLSYSSRINNPAINLSFPLPLDTNSPQVFSSHFIRTGWTWTITPALLNNLAVGYNRTNSHNAAQEALTGTTDWDQKLGIAGTPATTTFPQLGFNNSSDNISGFGQNTNNDVIDNGYRVNESLNWLHGKHNFKFGGQWYLQLFNPLTHSGESGTFNFSRNETSAIPNNSLVTGNSVASFLLGQVDNGSLSDHRIQFREISHYYNIYVEDDWKVAQQLTLNLGLSYSIDTPYRYANGNTSNIDLNTPNPSAGGFPGALVFAGTGAGRNGNVNETWARRWDKDVAPRVGFSYAPSYLKGLTVLRGYYGIFYSPMEHGDFNVQNVDGFTVNPNYTGNNFDPAFKWDAGFPAYAPPPNLDPAQDNFTSPALILPSYGRPGMVQNFSLQLQQQITTDLVFTLGYVGSRSEHLKSGFNFVNSNAPSVLGLGSKLGQPLSSLPGATLPYAGFPTTQTLGQSLRPHPQYLSLNSGEALEDLGAGSFDALEATLQRRFHNGLSLLASYTFSKTLTDSESAVPFFASFVQAGAGAQDPNHLKYEKSISSQSLPNNFVLSYLYQLPVGRGQHHLSNINRPLNAVVGGWQIGGVQRYESGQPINWGSATGVPGYDGSIHFLHNPGVPIYSSAWNSGHFNPLTDRMFNSHAFLDPNAQHDDLPDPVAARGGGYAFGNFERVTGNIRTHAYLSEDFSLNKRFPLFEKSDLFFQASLLDAFNRHDWAPPDPNPYGGSECQLGNAGCNTPYTFGQVGGTILGPRIIQLELRYEF